MSTRKNNADNAKGKKGEEAKENVTSSGTVEKITVVAVKPRTQVVVIDKAKKLEELMAKLNKLELLKKYYSKLKVKRNILQEAFDEMQKISNQKKDHFEEGENVGFPFEIALNGIGKHGSMEELFKISKKETVSNFTEFLLNQLNELLEAFEADLIEESEKGNI